MRSSSADRSAPGPYTDEEFDRHFRRTLRSDRGYVAQRLVVIAVVYVLMARAVVVYDLSAGFLLLPLAVEVLIMMWVGQLLKWTVVDCPAFAQTGRTGLVVVWTALVVAIVLTVLAVEDGSFDLSRVVPRGIEGWRKVLETGLVWVFVVELVGLVASTVPEVRRWRREGGRFLWTSIFDLSLRLAGALVVGVFGVVIWALLSDLVGGWLAGANRAAWVMWSFLLAVDLAGLLIGVKMHDELVHRQPLPSPAEPSR